MKVSIQELAILRYLKQQGGFTTRWIAHNVGGGAGHRQTALIRQTCLHLQRQRLITAMDDRKPICWILTKAGADLAAEGRNA